MTDLNISQPALTPPPPDIASSAHTESQLHPDRQFISFSLEGSEYGIPITSVREIKAWDGCTPLPNTPSHVLGVLNLRGTIVPIYDLRSHFGVENRDIGDRHVVMILYIGQRLAGLVADAVSDILSVSEDQIQEIPQLSTHSAPRKVEQTISEEDNTEFHNFNMLSGIINLDQRMVSIINVQFIFSLKDGQISNFENGPDFLPPPEA